MPVFFFLFLQRLKHYVAVYTSPHHLNIYCSGGCRSFVKCKNKQTNKQTNKHLELANLSISIATPHFPPFLINRKRYLWTLKKKSKVFKYAK